MFNDAQREKCIYSLLKLTKQWHMKCDDIDQLGISTARKCEADDTSSDWLDSKEFSDTNRNYKSMLPWRLSSYTNRRPCYHEGYHPTQMSMLPWRLSSYTNRCPCYHEGYYPTQMSMLPWRLSSYTNRRPCYHEVYYPTQIDVHVTMKVIILHKQMSMLPWMLLANVKWVLMVEPSILNLINRSHLQTVAKSGAFIL